MKKQWMIREAKLDDAVPLQRCMELAYAAYQQCMGGVRLPPMDLDYATEIRDYPAWVAESEGEIVGGLFMMFEESEASIANIAVHPEFQGQGLGGGLMRHAEGVAKERGYAHLHLATHVLLSENVSLYQHLGWSEAGRDDSRVLYMRKLI